MKNAIIIDFDCTITKVHTGGYPISYGKNEDIIDKYNIDKFIKYKDILEKEHNYLFFVNTRGHIEEIKNFFEDLEIKFTDIYASYENNEINYSSVIYWKEKKYNNILDIISKYEIIGNVYFLDDTDDNINYVNSQNNYIKTYKINSHQNLEHVNYILKHIIDSIHNYYQ